MVNKNKKTSGFTIVELLVVIVVIGILAAITVVSYTGITQKAAAVALKSDLKNATTQLELDKVTNGSYPASTEEANGGKGLYKSSNTDYQYTVASENYYLSATTSGGSASTTSYYVSSITSGIVQDGVWSGHHPSGWVETTWNQVATGSNYTCAISKNNGNAYCWGMNDRNQLGNNSSSTVLTPGLVTNTGVLSGKTIKYITGSGTGHTCVIASNDLAYCWGMNSSGGVGNNSVGTYISTPAAVYTSGVLNGKTIKAMSTGFAQTCAIASDDLAYCWGMNSDGQLGNNSTTSSLVPVAVDVTGVLSGKTIKAIATGSYFSCAIASDDQVYCWGSNARGVLGNNTAVTNSLVPVAVTNTGALSGKTVKSITAGDEHVCVIASDDKIYCWGQNYYGQLGIGGSVQSFNPNPVPVAVDMTGVLSGKTIVAAKAGGGTTCVIASNNQAYCWGNNAGGQLGNNSVINPSFVPMAVTASGALSGKTINSISTSANHTCAVASDNRLYCWGYNGYGQLGLGSSDVDVNAHRVPAVVVSP